MVETVFCPKIHLSVHISFQIVFTILLFSLVSVAHTLPICVYQERNLEKGEYAQYRIVSPFYDLINGSIITPADGEQTAFEGYIRWDVVEKQDTYSLIHLSVSLDSLEREKRLIVHNNDTWTFENGTLVGKLPFWVQHTEINQNISFSGIGESSAIGSLVIDGIKRTPAGWQECLFGETKEPLPFWNGSKRLKPWYYFDKDTGFVIEMSSDDPLWGVFGDLIVAGRFELQMTSLDLGPPQVLGDLILLLASGGWILAIFPAAFIFGVVLIWLTMKRQKQSRGKRGRMRDRRKE